eukprot:TRINITY_DN3681_c1_g3_i1.p1 TRINITY_DN3681_c1_g3~~TRINITY_DN3681_c1_g3_i1.p1  ORF type:complete len:350 (+),score=67.07 TRINITY_DN3681_c1_g3_i1:53-1051(+)
MQAIVVSEFGGPEVLRVVNVDKPKPGPKQVLVKIQAAGVNPVETYKRAGAYAAAVTLPWTPGSDGSGVVEELGSETSGLSVGDRVWLSGTTTGTYAQYALANISSVHVLPPNISFQQGAALNVPYATAYHALHHIGRPSERQFVTGNLNIFVHGASGGVGIAALQLAKSIPNVTIIGSAGTETGIQGILENGAHYAVNHREEGYMQKVLELTGGRGVDILLEMLANVNLANDCKVMAVGGRICVIGNRGTLEFNPRDLMSKRLEVRGVMLFQATPQEKEEIYNAIDKGLVDGSLKPIVSGAYPLKDAPQSHVDVISPPKGTLGKVVLTAWEE